MPTVDTGLSQRLIAVHPSSPLALKHDGAWQLQSYKTVAELTSSADVGCKTAVCSCCGVNVQMLTFVMVRHQIT